jgi:hypothetical protein
MQLLEHPRRASSAGRLLNFVTAVVAGVAAAAVLLSVFHVLLTIVAEACCF